MPSPFLDYQQFVEIVSLFVRLFQGEMQMIQIKVPEAAVRSHKNRVVDQRPVNSVAIGIRYVARALPI